MHNAPLRSVDLLGAFLFFDTISYVVADTNNSFYERSNTL